MNEIFPYVTKLAGLAEDLHFYREGVAHQHDDLIRAVGVELVVLAQELLSVGEALINEGAPPNPMFWQEALRATESDHVLADLAAQLDRGSSTT